MSRRFRFLRFLAPCVVAAGLGSSCQPKPVAERVPSVATGAPAVVTMPSGRTDVFVLGSDGNVWQSTCQKDCSKRANFADWSRQPGRPPGGATSDPAGVAWGTDRIDLFVRGAIANIWHQTWENGSWLGWEDLDGRTESGPSVTSWGPGNLHVFAVAGGALWHRPCVATDSVPKCRGTNWIQWMADPGTPPAGATSAGDTVSSGLNNVDIALRGRDGAVWFQRWSGYWIGWRSLGGKLSSAPTLVLGGGRTEVYALDESGGLVRAFLDSVDAPLAWSKAGIPFVGDPHGAYLSDAGRALVVSKPRGSYAFNAASCAPGADCSPM